MRIMDFTFFKPSCGDNRGQIKTLQNALKLKLDSAMLFNQLGYAYMAINKLIVLKSHLISI